jgi:glycosyltransferase involved in cell wall biosynthesis
LVDVVIIRSNSIINTPRVTKIARSLDKRYSTVVLGWNREGISKQLKGTFVTQLRLFGLRAPIGKPSLLLYFPLFWIWTFVTLVRYRPLIVHACDFDSVIPCYIYKAIFKKKLVFDVCDRYAMGYIPPRLKALFDIINSLEELFTRKADLVLTVGQKLLDTFRIKPKKYAVIMNCVNEIAMNRNEVIPERQHSLFRLAYTGNVRRDRGLETILKAIENIEGVEFVIAGRIIDRELGDRILESSNVRYMGLVLPNDALLIEKNSDAIIALYSLEYKQNYFAMPNKLFEAMMCELPIITNVAPEVVKHEVGCGIMVDYDDMKAVRNAIVTLRDKPGLRKKLGNNGRKAFLQKYNWHSMEKELLKAYQNLLEE